MHEKINEEVLATRSTGGYLVSSNIGLVTITGPDAGKLLQARASNDILALEPGQGQYNSFLDRKGYLQAFFSIYKLIPQVSLALATCTDNESYLVVTEKSQAKEIISQINAYCFREQVECNDVSDLYKTIIVAGPKASIILAESISFIPNSQDNINLLQEDFRIKEISICNKKCQIIKQSISGDDSYFVLVPSSDFAEVNAAIKKATNKNNIKEISSDCLDVLRIEAGIPLYGQDISQKELLPETGAEQYAASYTKGCFVGQEILARIKTHGAPRRALVGLILDNIPPKPLTINSPIVVNNQECGVIKSNCFSPILQKYIAFAYVAREYRVPNKHLEITCDGLMTNAQVKFLPFYNREDKKQKARQLYDHALQEFAKPASNEHDGQKEAVKMLRAALDLDPSFADAYESLGVMLSRAENYEEAISLMHKLQALDPDSIMAHSNLSLYYMQLGDKEKAEEEKAIAMGLRMSQLAKEMSSKEKEKKDLEKKLEQSKERISMFQKVLDIDSEDFLANYGLGDAYVDLGEFEKAIPYLTKTLELKPNHTVAYLALGKAYKNTVQQEKASQILQQGIKVASMRGDLSPMNEMQSLLHELGSKATSS